MWEKLMPASLWLVANPQLAGQAGNWVADVGGAITNVKRWVNDTDEKLEVWKYDDGEPQKKDHYEIGPQQVGNHDMYIPWAEDAAGYTAGRRAVIRLGGKDIAFLWQSGPLVRFNVTDQFAAAGFGVPGDPRAGGDRTVVVSKSPDGQVGFAVGKFQE